MDDDPLSPIEPLGTDAPHPPDAAPDRPRGPSRSRRVGDAGGEAPTAPAMSDELVHEQLEHPVRPPAAFDVPQIYDADAHVNRIAEAIEQAHVSDPTDRAQQLGGAAASAASGQAAQIDRSSDAATGAPAGSTVEPIEPGDGHEGAGSDRSRR